jgi:hypothetical protein
MIAKHTAVVGAWIIAGLGFVGCNNSSDVPNAPAGATSEVSSDAHSHGEWWCDEHGVEECAQCAETVADKAKAIGAKNTISPTHNASLPSEAIRL